MAPSRQPSGLTAIYAQEALPAAFPAAIFLAGLSGRTGRADGGSPTTGWRQEALHLLGSRGFDGVVFVPEHRPGSDGSKRAQGAVDERDRQWSWQEEAIAHCDLILMWLPAEALADPATVEAWGLWQRSGKVILGTPLLEGPLLKAAAARRIPITHSLAELVAMAQQLCRPGALRRGGERTVPLAVWRSPSFQSWYRALHRAGHRLDGVEVEWTHRARGVGRPPFLWALRPRVHVRGERRQLSGEVVIGRADISATVLYHRPPGAERADTKVVLVREFRAAVRNHGGFAWMLPGGSAARASERNQDPSVTAAQEIEEETGLRILPAQLDPVPLGDRQLLSSLSSHHAQLFRAPLTDTQLAALQKTEASGQPLGATPSERCYVSIRPLRDLLDEPDLDWSHLGMILYSLRDV